MDTIPPLALFKTIYKRPIRYAYRMARERHWSNYDRNHPGAAGWNPRQPDGSRVGTGRNAPGGMRHTLRTEWSQTAWGSRWKRDIANNTFDDTRFFNMRGQSPEMWKDLTEWLVRQTMLHVNTELQAAQGIYPHFERGFDNTKKGEDFMIGLMKTTVDSMIRDILMSGEIQRLDMAYKGAKKLSHYKIAKIMLIMEKNGLNAFNNGIEDIFKKLLGLLSDITK